MNTLRLENINLHAPYKVMQDPERRNNFYFVSDNGTRFDIDFTVNEAIIPSGAYEFGITNKQFKRSPHDNKLRLTIFAIIEEFFDVNGEDTMLYLAIISRRNNPNLPQAIAEFDETISFLFDPPEKSA